MVKRSRTFAVCVHCHEYRFIRARGLCSTCYESGVRDDYPTCIRRWGLVCTCPDPDLSGRFGQCVKCFRVPYEVMRERAERFGRLPSPTAGLPASPTRDDHRPATSAQGTPALAAATVQRPSG